MSRLKRSASLRHSRDLHGVGHVDDRFSEGMHRVQSTSSLMALRRESDRPRVEVTLQHVGTSCDLSAYDEPDIPQGLEMHRALSGSGLQMHAVPSDSHTTSVHADGSRVPLHSMRSDPGLSGLVSERAAAQGPGVGGMSLRDGVGTSGLLPSSQSGRRDAGSTGTLHGVDEVGGASHACEDLFAVLPASNPRLRGSALCVNSTPRSAASLTTPDSLHTDSSDVSPTANRRHTDSDVAKTLRRAGTVC